MASSYKRAALLIHPDKQNPDDYAAYMRATETFKIVSAAFAKFQVRSRGRKRAPAPSRRMARYC